MNALYICENLRDILIKEHSIKTFVHSVFDNALNLSSDTYFITLLNKGKNISPMSILVEDSKDFNFRELNIKQNYIFQFTEEYILCINNSLFINLTNAKHWSPYIVPLNQKFSEKQLNINVIQVEALLKAYGKLQGMGAIITLLRKEIPELGLVDFCCSEDAPSSFIIGALVAFLRKLMSNSIYGISEVAVSIIGFGIGLTPSIDDMLSGIMLTIRYLTASCNGDTQELSLRYAEIIRLAQDRTTAVSYEMLKHAASGRTNEAIKKLIEAIVYGNELNVSTTFERAVEYGETSGTDTVVGIYLGIKIWLQSPIKYIDNLPPRLGGQGIDTINSYFDPKV